MRPLPLLLLVACASPSGDVFEVCALDLTLSPASGSPGDTISVSGGPFSPEGVRDTRVEVGGVRAEVISVTREPAADCESCDTCRSDAGCAPCGICNGRLLPADERERCFGDAFASPPTGGICASCAQSMAFVVPAGAPLGWTSVWVVTRDGSSEPVPFEVTLPAPDTGDTGVAAHSGAPHTGSHGTTPTGP